MEKLELLHKIIVESELSKHNRSNYKKFSAIKLFDSNDEIDMCFRIYQQEWEKKIKNPELTNETKSYILNEVLADETPNDPILTKEQIDELTFKAA